MWLVAAILWDRTVLAGQPLLTPQRQQVLNQPCTCDPLIPHCSFLASWGFFLVQTEERRSLPFRHSLPPVL